MRWAAGILAVLLFPNPAFAQARGAVTFAAVEDRSVAVGLVQRADYIGRTLVIGSGEEEPDRRHRAISAARRAVFSALADSKQVYLLDAPAFVSSSGLTGGAGENAPSEARIHILLPIIDSDQDIFEGAIEIRELIAGLQIPGGVSLSLSPVSLAVDSAENYRGRIVEGIYSLAAALRERMKGSGRIIIEGLEGPVRVRQVDNVRVELYLDYSLVFEVQ